MSPRFLLILQWLRECDGKLKGDVFNQGYVLGFLNAAKYELEAWERQYLEVISTRVMKGLSS